jgi:uncharacterized protein
LLSAAYEHCGLQPTLLERDFNFPPLAELLSEIDTIAGLQQAWRDRDARTVLESAHARCA